MTTTETLRDIANRLEKLAKLYDKPLSCPFFRFDKNNRRIHVGDYITHVYSGKVYKVTYAEDICAFVIIDCENDDYEFMSEWIDEEWEVLSNG